MFLSHSSWFAEMDHAFNTNGKAKTFKKFANIKQEVGERKRISKTESPVKDEATNISNSDPEIDSDTTEIIIEPYEEPSYEIEEANPDTSVKEPSLTSTELFLQSLQNIFEKFTDQQNLRARIKIQEVLYNVMYEN